MKQVRQNFHSDTPDSEQNSHSLLPGSQNPKTSNRQRAARARNVKEHFASQEFSQKHHLQLFKTISTATSSRDLKQAVDSNFLTKIGEKALTLYRYQ
jgi:hypothetical protein